MLRGGISDPRNKGIMKMLNLISIGEHAGSGMPDIYSVWKDNSWQEPTVENRYLAIAVEITDLSFRPDSTRHLCLKEKSCLMYQ